MREWKIGKLEIKEAELKGERGYLAGWANRYIKSGEIVVDRQKDVIQPGALSEGKTVSLLLNHHPEEPVGKVYLSETQRGDGDYGIWFEGHVLLNSQSKRIRERAEEAFHGVKDGVYGYTSIGYIPLSYKFGAIGGERVRILEKIDVFELSLTPAPANPAATVEVAKGFGRHWGNEWVVNPITGENYGITWGQLREEIKKAASRAGHGVRLDQLADYTDSYKVAKAIQELAGSPIGQLAMNR